MGKSLGVTTVLVLVTAANPNHDTNLTMVGGVAQCLERWSLASDFPCPALDMQLMGDH